jgi:hypothetical protein
MRKTLKTMIVYIECDNTCSPPLKYRSELPSLDGTIEGRFVDLPKGELTKFLKEDVLGTVYTYLPGQKYRVSNLTVDGAFRLVPDSFEKHIVVGVDRNEPSGVVAPNEPILCGFEGYSDQDITDLHRRYAEGTFVHHTIAGQNYKVTSFSPARRQLTLMLDLS